MPQNVYRVPFDSLTLRAVATELRGAIVGGHLQDVRQPLPSELRLGIRCRGRNLILAISCDARFARVHLVSGRKPNAAAPPAFCIALRKHAEGGLIRDVRQIGFDRIIEVDIEKEEISGARRIVTLISELMGKHSNIVLVTEGRVIIDSVKRISRRINRFRETLPGLEYHSPPAPIGKLDPLAVGPATLPSGLSDRELAEAIVQQFDGISPYLARELAWRARASSPHDPHAGLPTAWRDVFAPTAEGIFHPALFRDSTGAPVGAYPIPIFQPLDGVQEPIASLNDGLDAAYQHLIDRAGVQSARTELQGRIARERSLLERQAASAAEAIAESDRAETHRRSGEFILANLARIRPGDSSVEVQDYYDRALPNLVIPIDPHLTPQENAAAAFRRYRKAEDAREVAARRAAEAARARASLDDAEIELGRLTTEEAVRQLSESLSMNGVLRTSEAGAASAEELAGADFEGHHIRRTVTPDGFEILYGVNALANDFLTTRIARPTDIWLHVRAAVSAHVVIRTQGKPEAVPYSVVRQAAVLCARHSAQKHSSLVSVDYTLRRYVRKPRRAAPGSVDYAREKTLEIENPQSA